MNFFVVAIALLQWPLVSILEEEWLQSWVTFWKQKTQTQVSDEAGLIDILEIDSGFKLKDPLPEILLAAAPNPKKPSVAPGGCTDGATAGPGDTSLA